MNQPDKQHSSTYILLIITNKSFIFDFSTWLLGHVTRAGAALLQYYLSRCIAAAWRSTDVLTNAYFIVVIPWHYT